MDPLVGTEVRGYLLQNQIGVGGFGNVYQARQISVNREVAIKVILPEYASKPDFIRRFEIEARLIARLEHLHIVPLYDYWRDPDGAYLTMRLMRGGNLKDQLKTGPLDIETIAKWVDQIANALDSAHKQGVIHRDIKPSNILLDEDNNAYLSDFGIAKDLEHQNTSLSRQEVLIGTLDYLAPEQAVKDEITPQTDIYSFGVLLYEMLTGQHPFPGISGVERLFKHINEPLPKIPSLDPQISDAVNLVVQTATQKNPANRYHAATEFAKAFRDAAALSPSRIDSELVELLTPREQEVLSYIIKGKSNREIAEKLTIEFSTVKWYIRQIYKKLNVRSRVQAIVRSRELNLILVDNQEVISQAASSSIDFSAIKNPYKGLKAFQAIDEQDFFGREGMTQNLLDRLTENHKYARFLAVIGPSGSGKSSLVKAGLIPALWRGRLPGSEKWFIVDMVSGEHPFDELEVALIRIAADRQHNLREQLQRDARGLVRAANLVLPDDQSELVLVLDQFEDLFTLVNEEEVRSQFLEMLYTTVTDPRSRVRVVLTLRADFYDRPLHYSNFGDLVRSRIETVMPLSAKELERAIVQPAKRVGVEFEEGLVTSIINEVHYQSGALPLMQYALTELFEAKQSRILTHECYHRIGGVVGAIAKSAEEVYRELDSQGKEAVRQLFVRLVNLGEGSEDTRRRVYKSELLSITDTPEVMDDIIDTFANYRLLSLDNDPMTRSPVVEVAHEAILHEWDRLDAWLDESREDIRQERLLAAASKEWRENGEDKSFLLRGARLQYFENWVIETRLALTPLEIEFVHLSMVERDFEKQLEYHRIEREKKLELRNKRFLQALVFVFAFAAVVSFWFARSAENSQQIAEAEANARSTAQAIAEDERQAAILQAEARATAEAIALDERQQALIQASIGLAALSEQELFGFYPERAVLLALEAMENYPYTPQAYHALTRAVYSSRMSMTIDAHQSMITDLRLSRDGSTILSGAQDGFIKIWDSVTGEELLSIHTGKDQTDWVTWSPDETKILSAAHNGAAGWSRFEEGVIVGIWDAVTGELIRILPAGGDWYATWSPDGTKVITSRGSNLITVWDAETGEKLMVLDKHTAISRVRADPETWSPDGTHFVSCGEDGTAIIWNLETGEDVLTLAGHQGVVMYAKYSPNGERIATIGSDDNRVIVWDANTGEAILTYEFVSETGQPLNDASWSPSSEYLAIEIGWEDPFIIDASTGEVVLTLPGHIAATQASWSPKGDLILTSSDNGIGYVWDVGSGNKLFTLYGHTSTISATIWFEDESHVITASNDGSIKVWKMILAPLVTKGFSAPGVGLTGAGAWSPDGTRYARAYMNGTIIIWDTESGEAIRQIDGLNFAAHVTDWYEDGRLLVNASIYNNKLLIFDGDSGELLQTIDTGIEVGGIVMIWAKFSPDGSKIAVSGWDATARIYDASSGDLLMVFQHLAGVWGIDWSPDGKQIVTGSWDHTAKIWDVETGKLVADLYPEDYGKFVYSVAWSPDGTRIVTGGGGGIATIWDLTGGREPIKLEGHTADYYSLNWSPDGKFILSSNYDNTGRVWDANTGIELAIYDIGLTSGGFLSPDGTRVGFSVVDGTVRFYPVLPDMDELIEYAHDCCVVRELTEQERKMFGLDPLE